MDPIKFKTGDLVEAQVSFVGVPLKGGGMKMMTVLRALTLLDCQESMVYTYSIVWPSIEHNDLPNLCTNRMRNVQKPDWLLHQVDK